MSSEKSSTQAASLTNKKPRWKAAYSLEVHREKIFRLNDIGLMYLDKCASTLCSQEALKFCSTKALAYFDKAIKLLKPLELASFQYLLARVYWGKMHAYKKLLSEDAECYKESALEILGPLMDATPDNRVFYVLNQRLQGKYVSEFYHYCVDQQCGLDIYWLYLGNLMLPLTMSNAWNAAIFCFLVQAAKAGSRQAYIAIIRFCDEDNVLFDIDFFDKLHNNFMENANKLLYSKNNADFLLKIYDIARYFLKSHPNYLLPIEGDKVKEAYKEKYMQYLYKAAKQGDEMAFRAVFKNLRATGNLKEIEEFLKICTGKNPGIALEAAKYYTQLSKPNRHEALRCLLIGAQLITGSPFDNIECIKTAVTEFKDLLNPKHNEHLKTLLGKNYKENPFLAYEIALIYQNLEDIKSLAFWLAKAIKVDLYNEDLEKFFDKTPELKEKLIAFQNRDISPTKKEMQTFEAEIFEIINTSGSDTPDATRGISHG